MKDISSMNVSFYFDSNDDLDSTDFVNDVINVMSEALTDAIFSGAPDDEVIKRVEKSKEILDRIRRKDQDNKKVAELFPIIVDCLNKYGWVNICGNEDNSSAEDKEAVVKVIKHLQGTMDIGEYKSGSVWFAYTDRVDKDYILSYYYGIRHIRYDTNLDKVYGFDCNPDDIDIYKAYYAHPDWGQKTLCDYIEKELCLYTNPGSLVHLAIMAPYILWKHGISPKECKTITDARNLLIKRCNYFGSKKRKNIENDITLIRQLPPSTRCGSTFNILVQHMCNLYINREDETSRGVISMNALSSLNDCLFISDDEFVILTLMYDICSYGCWNGKGLFNDVIRSLNDSILRISYNDNEEVKRFCDEVAASL